ncbi:MAG: Ig-like domain-containing protein [Gemmatimonadales bacterium]|nr:Ig-like domain-containing protein [Gemmatimonadales bacterium]
MKVAASLAATVLFGACKDSTAPGGAAAIAAKDGTAQTAQAATALPLPLRVLVTDAASAPVSGVTVQWVVASGNGTLSAPSSVTDAAGIASVILTLGPTAGTQQVRAVVSGLAGSPVTFSATATAGPPGGGGVATRLILKDGGGQTGPVGTALAQPLRVSVLNALDQPVSGVTVQWAVTAGGGTVSTASSVSDAAGTASVILTLGTTAGLQQVTASSAGLTGSPATFSATATAAAQTDPVLVNTVSVPANYGAHDTFVRDGYAFAFIWNSGLRIYDVGNGSRGGSPANPVLVSSFVTSAAGSTDGPNVHNGWWFHNPVTNEKRYLFVGQEGPARLFLSTTGDIHVVDVSNLSAPQEVAFYHYPSIVGDSVGVHNFWMDEPNQILYAAFYNGGVVALDVSGTLSGDLAGRVIAQLRPGGAGNTFTWGVQLANGSLYAIDMLSGLSQLRLQGNTLSKLSGGSNVPERYSSDLWVHGNYAYTGTWNTRGGNAGNVLKVWQLSVSGAPTLVDSIKTVGISTVSDVEVTPDGRWLLFTAEGGAQGGLYLYSLADPAHPVFATKYIVSTGLHTGTFATINRRRYVFAAKNPASPAMMIFDVTAATP